MVIVGNRMWNEMFAPNWMRERMRVSTASALLLLAGHKGYDGTRRSDHLAQFVTGFQERHELFGLEPVHLVVEAGHRLDQLAQLGHAAERVGVHAFGRGELKLAKLRERRVDLPLLPLRDEDADDLPQVLGRGEVVARSSGRCRSRTRFQDWSSLRLIETLERETWSAATMSSAQSGVSDRKRRA
jgi:hypothetical protein